MLYKVSKRMEIAGSHRLELDYDSPCSNLHGHNWIITVYCASSQLNNNGMVIDFKHIKEEVHDKLDHTYINDIININPTAENIACYILEAVNECLSGSAGFCYKVEVQESEGNIASYCDMPKYLSENEIMGLLA